MKLFEKQSFRDLLIHRDQSHKGRGSGEARRGRNIIVTAMGSLARKRGQNGRDLEADEKWGMDKGSLNPTGPWHPSLRPERGPQRRGRRRPSLPLAAALPPALALPANTRAPARPGWVRARTVLRMRGVPGAGNPQD